LHAESVSLVDERIADSFGAEVIAPSWPGSAMGCL
jgi:hypothetical protein